MVRYFGPGHAGTVETIFRLAVERCPGRWNKSSIPVSERKIWDKLREGLGDGSRRVDIISIEETLRVEVPRPHDAGLMERHHDVMDACLALRISLDSGTICANYRDENGAQHAVPVEFWRGDDECVIAALLSGAAYLDVETNDESISHRLLRLPTPELNKAWPELISREFRESKGDGTTEHGFDFDATHLAEVMPRLQGDTGPLEVGTNDAGTPTKELKRLYPDGATMKMFMELGKAALRRRGRPHAVDWESIRISLYEKCKEQGGVPSPEIGDGWSIQADAERFVQDIVDNRAQKTAVRDHVSKMLRDFEAGEGR
jgi:hypothetical protein